MKKMFSYGTVQIAVALFGVMVDACMGKGTPLQSFSENSRGEIEIPAAMHDKKSPNIVSIDFRYGGLSVCEGSKGLQQWRLSLKEDASRYLHFYYTAKASRPVSLSLNGKEVSKKILAGKSGSWRREGLIWESAGPFHFRAGENLLTLSSQNGMPHLAGIVVSKSRDRWNRHAFKILSSEEQVERLIEEGAQKRASARSALRKALGVDEILFIKRVPYSASHYYSEYIDSRWTPGGGIFILSLRDGSERQIAAELTGGVFGRMDLSFDGKRVVFDWKRSKNEGYRIYEVGVAPSEQRSAGGAGARLILPPPENERELVRKYTISGYHHGTDDMHPCYLPDGGIAFVSTRCQTSTLCHGGDVFTTTVLYRMDLDGKNLRQLSFGALSEFTPTVLPDGRIMYARWEYVDKGAVAAKCIWAMRPDGTMSSEIYGNDIPSPTTMIQARAIPGTPNGYVILGCPHNPETALGTIIRLDMNKPVRSDAPMTWITPYVKIKRFSWIFSDLKTGKGVEERIGYGPLFRDPWPIDKNRFLVAHKPRSYGDRLSRNGFGLSMLDERGEVTSFYHDPKISSWQPMPLSPRTRPPLLKSLGIDNTLAKRGMAKCIVQDIYRGMEDTPRGTIRYLRILEQVARPWCARRFGREMSDHYDQQHAVISKDTALGLKIQHGIVPVESDGSASFLVPANANIFFQALDKNYLAVQTERTFVNFMPGEVRSCIGCHETPDDAPLSPSAPLLAMKRAPSLPSPQPGERSGNRVLHYPSDVQPVLDRHCVSCHGEKVKRGGLDLSGRMTKFFSVSYESLIAKRWNGRVLHEPGLVPTIGENHPKDGNIRYLPARSLGSHNSLLMAMLMPGAIRLTGDRARMERLGRLTRIHRNIKLSREELLKISNWVDTNAQYYGSYFGRRNIRDRGHPNFRPVPTWDSARGILPAGKR